MVQVKRRTPEQLCEYIASRWGQQIPINIRIRFFKRGPLSYISHLDLVRTMSKIVVRSRLPLWYTEGFNPKPKLVFAAPLSIGVESEVEYMDLRLSRIIPECEVIEKLNAAMPPDMQVLAAYYPVASLSELGYLSYKIVVQSPDVTAATADAVREALGAERIEIEKKTKSGEARTVDIKGQIRSVDVSVEDGALVLCAVLCASPDSFLNPEYLISYLKRTAGLLRRERLTEESYSVVRTKAYFGDLTEFE